MSPSALFSPGRTIWKAQPCRRLGFLIDAKSYFVAVAEALAQAKHRIMIVGWDFDSRIRLRPDNEQCPTLGNYLQHLVEANTDLDIYVSIWRNSVFYASNPDIPLLPVSTWWDHPRIHYKLDDHHPMAACLHEKIVSIDDSIAFIGGMDLTDARWDEETHRPDHPLRLTAAGAPYRPVHDVQAVLDGDAARALAQLSRARWQASTGETLAAVDVAGGIPWPGDAHPVIDAHDVAISRTRPPYDSQDEAREVEAMNMALVKAAQRSIYIETQYFALPEVASLLGDRLDERDGPEIVIVATLQVQGAMEQYVMAESRDRLFAELHRRDRFGRLRTYYPVSSTDPLCDIKVHSKVIVVDDRLLRVGSSNLNARSTGLDTECDIVIDGATTTSRRAVADLRDRLLAEHVGAAPEAFTAAVDSKGSLIAAIESLNGGARRLMEFSVPDSPPEILTPVANLLDPSRPLDLKYIWDSLTSSPR